MHNFMNSALRWFWTPWVQCRAGLASLAGPILLPFRLEDSEASTSKQPPNRHQTPLPPTLPSTSFSSNQPPPEQQPVPSSTSPTAGLSPTLLPPPPRPAATATITEPSTSPTSPAMATEAALRQTLQSLTSAQPASPQATKLLSTAKKQLMQLGALIPTSGTPPTLLPLARAALEAGALLSIGAQDPDAFTRYYQQLQPFYALPAGAYQPAAAAGEHQRSKITGLYLLLLLTKGDYAGFHTLLEGLEAESAEQAGGNIVAGIEHDRFIRYPVELEQALMEGAYDRVWKATKGEGVPSEEFGVFSEILIGTIRSEIASCSEKAYPSIPVANAKNLLFLDSEGSVVQFAQDRGWVVRDGRVSFPQQQGENVRTEKEILVTSGQVIENTIGYARELETIV